MRLPNESLDGYMARLVRENVEHTRVHGETRFAKGYSFEDLTDEQKVESIVKNQALSGIDPELFDNPDDIIDGIYRNI